MKCPECDGVGYFEEELKEKFLGKTKYAVIKCDVCNGTGEINAFKPQTNEEYIRTANTNDMARCIATKLCELAKREYGIYDVVDYATIFEWLKEKHTNV